MKLGTETGSLINHILSRAVVGQPEPAVGMGATILAWTDRYAATITFVTTDRGRKILWVKRDKAKRIDSNGLSESQEYLFESNPLAPAHVYQQQKDGGWIEVEFNAQTKRYRKVGGNGLRIGEREEYRDFSF